MKLPTATQTCSANRTSPERRIVLDCCIVNRNYNTTRCQLLLQATIWNYGVYDPTNATGELSSGGRVRITPKNEDGRSPPRFRELVTKTQSNYWLDIISSIFQNRKSTNLQTN